MKRLLPLLAVAALVSTLAACGGGGGGSSNTTSTNAASNVPNPIVWCVDTTYPPAESIVNGKAAGYDIDIANAIAKQLGSTAQIKTTGFTVIIPALKAEEVQRDHQLDDDHPGARKQVALRAVLDVGQLPDGEEGEPGHTSRPRRPLSGKSAAVEIVDDASSPLCRPRTRPCRSRASR